VRREPFEGRPVAGEHLLRAHAQERDARQALSDFEREQVHLRPPEHAPLVRRQLGPARGVLGLEHVRVLGPEPLRDQRDRGDLYLSFTGGPTLERIERELGSPRALAFHCLVDPEGYAPRPEVGLRWDLGYLGTYSDDRQPALDALLVEPARRDPSLRAIVAGPQYPEAIEWPPNVERVEHLPPAEHPRFYAAQRLTVSVTRADMMRAGWSPSVRLFEAAACAVPVVTDPWPGVEDFFAPGSEILVARGPEDVAAHLALSEEELRAVGERARARVLAEHTAEHRAAELVDHVRAARGARA
jgi:spore maturation protein CgeB